jgi:hypothetical protein
MIHKNSNIATAVRSAGGEDRGPLGVPSLRRDMDLSPGLLYRTRRYMASMHSPPYCVYTVHRDMECPLCRAYNVHGAILPTLITTTEFIGLWAFGASRRIKLLRIFHPLESRATASQVDGE